MSKTNENLLASLLKIGDVRCAGKGPGEGSSSRAVKEGGSETAAVGNDAIEVDDDPEEQAKERKRARSGKQPEKQGEKLRGLSADCLVECEDDLGQTSKGADSWSHRPAPIAPEERNFIRFLSDLPSEAEWKSMGEQPPMNLFQEMMAIYGQLGVRMAGCSSVVHRDLKTIGEARQVIASSQEKDAKIAALEKQLAELQVQSEKLKKGYNDALRQRDIVSEKSKGYKAEVKKLREELEGRKPEDQVIKDFRKSDAYDKELSDVAAMKIRRCWIVAEAYIKTDPEADWQGFVAKYVAAEDALARGEPEPEPFVPPPKD